MTTTPVPRFEPRVRLPLAPALRTLAAVRVGAARLIGWYAADTRRLKATLAGLVVCTATGAAIGASVGLAADAAVEAIHHTVVSGP